MTESPGDRCPTCGAEWWSVGENTIADPPKIACICMNEHQHAFPVTEEGMKFVDRFNRQVQAEQTEQPGDQPEDEDNE